MAKLTPAPDDSASESADNVLADTRKRMRPRSTGPIIQYQNSMMKTPNMRLPARLRISSVMGSPATAVLIAKTPRKARKNVNNPPATTRLQ